MRKNVNPLFLMGLIGTLVIGSHFAAQYGRALWGDRDIWWTPRTMAVSLEDTKQAFELYVSGTLLRDHLERGSLSAVAANGTPYRVAQGDIRVRLNNWYKVNASLLHSAVPSAFLLGVSVTCLTIGIVQWTQRREESLNDR
jgi:hypothetical protein